VNAKCIHWHFKMQYTLWLLSSSLLMFDHNYAFCGRKNTCSRHFIMLIFIPYVHLMWQMNMCDMFYDTIDSFTWILWFNWVWSQLFIFTTFRIIFMLGKNQSKFIMIMLLKVVLEKDSKTIQVIQSLSKLTTSFERLVLIYSFIVHKHYL